jgi:hypothetical protein
VTTPSALAYDHVDLTAVKDRPATLLRIAADNLVRVPMPAEDSALARGLHVAAATLDSHEREHGVTFAALDNDALEAVRDAYEALKTGVVTVDKADDLLAAVQGLLGLGE